MAHRAKRLRWFLWIPLLFLLTTTAAREPASAAVSGNPQQRDGGDGDWHTSAERAEDGTTALEEATLLLRQMKPAGNRLARFNRPSGVLGTTAYYAKELFFLLFMNGPPSEDEASAKPAMQKLKAPLTSAKRLLEEAAANNRPEAIFMLAEMNFHGNYSHPRNYTEALRLYHDLAALNGNATAQHMLGFMYATGIGGAAKPDQAKAMLYHKFATEGGDVRSEMTMAFRHHNGIATPRACEEAVVYYKKVADKAIGFMRSGPPGGHSMVRESYRLADEFGGVYGEGASVSSAGAKAGSSGPDDHGSFDNIMEYMDLMSRKGDLKATYGLGKIYYDGSRAVRRDLKMAKKQFFKVARQYWAEGGRIKNDVSPGTEKLASKAAGYLGRMFLRGEGTEQSFQIARTWFTRGIANGDALCQYSMGLMYLHGLGVPRDPVKAADYFGPAADQELASAQVQLGALFLDQGDVSTATQYFDAAARHGHLEGFYYLAELTEKGVGRDRACTLAAAYYKIVAEKAEAILSPFQEANAAYSNGDLDSALVYYMMAAEQGFEIGQANVAFLLDRSRPRFSLGSVIPFMRRKVVQLGDAALALIYWTRSAKQSNIDSMVKMGDYYLEGIGTAADNDKAAACYQAAAETMMSAQALWNLGWMHENGVGIEQDFHLAKRFYDQALETNHEAFLPVTLALYKLRLRSFWNTVTNGNVKSIEEEPSPENQWSWSEWLANFLADAAYYDDPPPDDWDSTQPHDPMPGGDDGLYDEIDEGIFESLIIVSLAAALAFLVFYRQQRQLNHRRAMEQQAHAAAATANQGQQQGQQGQQGEQGQQGQQGEQQEEQDRGVFPPPEDPDFNNWVAGGVGH